MKRFKKIYIEITNVCNLKCSFCPVTNRSAELMTLDRFIYILDEVKELTDYIYLHVKGEPLLHPNLGGLLDLANDKGLQVNLTTNGTLINNCRGILLSKPSLRQINISLHSLEQNEWFGGKEEYLDNIMNFIHAAQDTKLIVALRLWNLTSENDENQAKNKTILKRLEEEFGLKYDLMDEFIKKRGIKIGDRLYLNEDLEFTWPDLNSESYEESGFCYGLRDQLGILVDGTIIPCCLDGEGIINLGNIFDNKLKDILNTERVKNIYDNFSNRHAIEELCRRCGFKNKFS